MRLVFLHLIYPPNLTKVHGRNITLVRYPQFIRLVQVGLPSRLRGEMWEILSGSIYDRFANPGEYQRILELHDGQSRYVYTCVL